MTGVDTRGVGLHEGKDLTSPFPGLLNCHSGCFLLA